jgi:hypothetical protein
MTKLSDKIEAEIVQAIQDCQGGSLGVRDSDIVEAAQLACTAIMWSGPAQIRQLVDKQAEDDGLWFRAQTAPEAYLQAALRNLHEEVERHVERVAS